MTMRALCAAANVRQQYLGRWKSGAVEPTLRLFGATMRSLEAVLDARERELFAHLAARLLPREDAEELAALVEQAAAQGVSVNRGAREGAVA